MAKLYFYYASMNAGKSTTLLQADFNYRERGMATMLWTAAIDDRAPDQAIASRIGLGAQAHRFDAGTDLHARVAAANAVQPLACVLIDEAQFLSHGQVWQLARLADEDHVRLLDDGREVALRARTRLGTGNRRDEQRSHARAADRGVPPQVTSGVS